MMYTPRGYTHSNYTHSIKGPLVTTEDLPSLTTLSYMYESHNVMTYLSLSQIFDDWFLMRFRKLHSKYFWTISGIHFKFKIASKLYLKKMPSRSIWLEKVWVANSVHYLRHFYKPHNGKDFHVKLPQEHIFF